MSIRSSTSRTVTRMGRVSFVFTLGAGLLTLATPCLSAQFQSVRVQVIDRGQADGILIRTPNSRWIVIDAGTNSRQRDAMASQWGVDSLALAIVSHRHADHLGGMPAILRAFPVGLLVMNLDDCPGVVGDDRVRAVADTLGIPTQSVGADTLEVDGVQFILLPPGPPHPCPSEENNNSIVVRMEFGQFSMLFTGDSETDEREWLMENHAGLLAATVLKASHHGSTNGADGTSDGRGWIDFVSPADVIISAHLESQFGHPHAEAMEAYEASVGVDRIFCTSRHGTIRVYGFADGRRQIGRQFTSDASCRFGSPTAILRAPRVHLDRNQLRYDPDGISQVSRNAQRVVVTRNGQAALDVVSGEGGIMVRHFSSFTAGGEAVAVTDQGVSVGSRSLSQSMFVLSGGPIQLP